MLDHFIATYRHRSCTWEQCLQVAASYQEQWRGYMITNRSDAEALHAGMNAIEQWCYSNIPAPMYDELCEVMGYTPRSTLNMFNGPD